MKLTTEMVIQATRRDARSRPDHEKVPENKKQMVK